MTSIRMSVFLPNLNKWDDALYIFWLIVGFMLDLRVSQRSVLAERLQCSWADVQYLAYVLVVKPFTKTFVCSSTSHYFHLIDEAAEVRQQFLVSTALY